VGHALLEVDGVEKDAAQHLVLILGPNEGKLNFLCAQPRLLLLLSDEVVAHTLVVEFLLGTASLT
jgi:hypothetical protein